MFARYFLSLCPKHNYDFLKQVPLWKQWWSQSPHPTCRGGWCLHPPVKEDDVFTQKATLALGPQDTDEWVLLELDWTQSAGKFLDGLQGQWKKSDFIITKNFNTLIGHGYHGSKHCKLVQHLRSCGSHAFTHTLTSTVTTTLCEAPAQLLHLFYSQFKSATGLNIAA